MRWRRLRSKPGRRPPRELERRGHGQRLDLDRHRPEPVAGDGEHAARGTERGRVEHAPARRGQVAHAVALHGEQADLAGRAEAVLDPAEHAVLAEPLALEIEDDVDHVLERARAGDRALLGDMPDEEHGHAGRLGDVAHAQDRGADLRDAARRSGGRRRRAGSAPNRPPPATGAPPRWWRSRCRRRIRRAGEPWHRYTQAAELAGQAAQATPRRCSRAPVTPRRRSCATSAARWSTSRCQGHHRAARRCRERSPLPGRGRLRTNRWPAPGPAPP